MLLGLRTVIYPAPDLEAAKRWWSEVLGVQPYFDEPFYVAFEPGGYELGLDPNADPELGPRTYWGVRNVDEAVRRMVEAGASVREPVAEPGDGIRLGVVLTPDGNPVGLIENPIFAIHEPENAGEGAGL